MLEYNLIIINFFNKHKSGHIIFFFLKNWFARIAIIDYYLISTANTESALKLINNLK